MVNHLVGWFAFEIKERGVVGLMRAVLRWHRHSLSLVLRVGVGFRVGPPNTQLASAERIVLRNSK